MKKFINLFFSLICLLVMVGCPVTENDNKQSQPTKKKLPHLEVLKLSNSYSDFMKETFNDMNYSEPFDEEKLPDVVVVNSKDIAGLTNEQWRLLVSACLEEKTLIIDNPSQMAMFAFNIGVNTVLSLDEHLRIKYNVTSNSLANLLLQKNLYNAPTDPSDDGYLNPDKSYEAIGIKGLNINFIHNINDMLEQEVEVVTEDESGDKKTEKVKVQIDESEVRKSLASSFADWINGFNDDKGSRGIEEAKEYFRSRAELDVDLKSLVFAQKFTNTFTIFFSVKEIIEEDNWHYDEFKDRTANVTADTYVWSVCDIDNQKDYYLVNQVINVHNEQLKYECHESKWWKKIQYRKERITGPYFASMDVIQKINQNNINIIKEQCIPRDDVSSTNEYSFRGNVGLSKSGLLGGVSGGASFSSSKCSQIPDINIRFSSTNQNDWLYSAQDEMLRRLTMRNYNTRYTPDPCLINLQSFDSYSLYELPSDESYNGECEEVLLVFLTNITLELIYQFFDSSYSNFIQLSNRHTRFLYIKKPNNAYKTYLFEFNRVISPEPEEEKTLHQKILLDILGVKGWSQNPDIYAFGQDKVDGVVIDCFKDIQEYIELSREELENNSFNGTYKFSLKEADALYKEIYNFENTFDGVPFKK